jgi:hypothetical protein
MKFSETLKLFLRSGLNLILFTGSVGLSLSLLFFTELIWGLSLLAGAGAYLLTGTVALSTPMGAKAISRIKQKDRKKQLEHTLSHYQALRESLVRLRVSDEDLKKRLEYFLLVSGEYLEAAQREGDYSPEAHHAMDKVQRLCQLILEEQDEESTQERYAIADTDDFEVFRAQAFNLIEEHTQTISRSHAQGLHEITREEELEIAQEMRALQRNRHEKN